MDVLLAPSWRCCWRPHWARSGPSWPASVAERSPASAAICEEKSGLLAGQKLRTVWRVSDPWTEEPAAGKCGPSSPSKCWHRLPCKAKRLCHTRYEDAIKQGRWFGNTLTPRSTRAICKMKECRSRIQEALITHRPWPVEIYLLGRSSAAYSPQA